MKAAAIRLANVGKCYGEQWVVKDVSLHVHAGEFFTFLGPSGCGKTTLLRMIAGFVTPDEGLICLDDQPVNHAPPWQRGIGMVFQNYALWPHLTVFENIAFGLRERKIPRPEIASRVAEVLEKVGLEGTESRRPSQLSGGQQQRVALARTLVIQPRALLLDEPLSNLDAKLRAEMRLELLKLQRDLGLTTIYVTHDQDEALAMSTRIAVMNQGRVVQAGKPHEIYEQPASDFVAAFVGQSNLLPGIVRQTVGDRIVVDLGPDTIAELADKYSSASYKTGDAVLLSVRPEAIDVIKSSAISSDHLAIPGELIASRYQGAFIEYEIAALGRSFTARATHVKGKRLFEPGERVAMSFAVEDIMLIAGRKP